MLQFKLDYDTSQSQMRCPKCNVHLVKMKELVRYETLDEHVTQPNQTPRKKPALRCQNFHCDLNHDEIFWDHMGECYGRINAKECINEISAAMNSFARKSAVEIYKTGVPEYKYVLDIGKFSFRIKIDYRANKDGEVLSKKYKLRILKKSETGGYVYITNPFGMIKYSIDEYFRMKKKSKLDVFEYIDDLKPRPWSSNINWRNTAIFILKYPLFQYFTFKQYEKHKEE